MRRKITEGDTEQPLVKIDPEPDALREALEVRRQHCLGLNRRSSPRTIIVRGSPGCPKGDLAVVLLVVRQVHGGHGAFAKVACDLLAVREGGTQSLSHPLNTAFKSN